MLLLYAFERKKVLASDLDTLVYCCNLNCILIFNLMFFPFLNLTWWIRLPICIINSFLLLGGIIVWNAKTPETLKETIDIALNAPYWVCYFFAQCVVFMELFSLLIKAQYRNKLQVLFEKFKQ